MDNRLVKSIFIENRNLFLNRSTPVIDYFKCFISFALQFLCILLLFFTIECMSQGVFLKN
jgi:hypothetical protein